MKDHIPVQKKKIHDDKAMIERYEGKQALLATWEKFIGLDRSYRNGLKRRVDHYKRELVYKGAI